MTDYVFLTEIGKRENNEDYYGNYKNEFFVVCDGLSGQVYGEIASKIAVDTAVGEYKKLKKIEKETETVTEKEISRAWPSGLDELFEKANQAIIDKANEEPKYLGMGTTMVALVFNIEGCVIGNVGDCRAYLLSSGNLQKLAQDDRDLRGYLTKALGLDEKVNPTITKKKVIKGDLILLCSDGLFDFVKDNIIEKILSSEADLPEKAKGLIDAALQLGSTDNITVGLVSV